MRHFLVDCLSLGAILSGILVISTKNPVLSILYLISVFVTVASYLLFLGIGFIGISYLIVYVGAIAILFLFVVIMLNIQLAEISSVGKEYTKNLPLGFLVGSLFIFEINSLLPYIYIDTDSFINLFSITSDIFTIKNSIFTTIIPIFTPFTDLNISPSLYSTFSLYSSTISDTIFSSFSEIQAIGQILYTIGSLWLVVASVILLLSIVGPIILTLKSTDN